MSASPSGPRGDSSALAGTHDGAIAKTRSGEPSAASSSHSAPSAPSTLAISCGSQTTAVVPRATTDARELRRQQLRRLEVDVRVDEAGHERPAGGVDPLAAVVGADAGDPAVGDRDVARRATRA